LEATFQRGKEPTYAKSEPDVLEAQGVETSGMVFDNEMLGWKVER
jgi:hypothetical protein